MRMNNPTRYTDPFGYVSSGSEHDAVFHQLEDDHDESPNLSDLVECFLEQQQQQDYTEVTDYERAAAESGSDRPDPILIVHELLQNSDSSSYKRTLESHVAQAVKSVARFGSIDKQTSNRNVMYFLRKLGHNAAICKTKWDSSGGSLAAGTYEFIDVDTKIDQTRYFIDIDFAAEFEIARPTEHYSNLQASLPIVLVTKEEALKKVVKVVAEEAKRSLKRRDLHLPPWRKNRYMQMKWFGPYKRTTNLFPTAVTSPLPSVNPSVNCTRFVGFEVGSVTEERYTVRTR